MHIEATPYNKALTRTRAIIETLLTRLEDELDSSFEKEQQNFSRSWLWGEKENAVSVVVKLGQLLMKLAELEQQAPKKTPELAEEREYAAPLSEGDWSILERYITKRKSEMGG